MMSLIEDIMDLFFEKSLETTVTFLLFAGRKAPIARDLLCLQADVTDAKGGCGKLLCDKACDILRWAKLSKGLTEDIKAVVTS
jgi:hypothetical protein